MTGCRVCDATVSAPVYEASSPALTSVMTRMDVPTRVHLCTRCGHAQGGDLPDVASFYDRDYRISLASEDHDQIVAAPASGAPLYRTDLQAEIGLRLLDLPVGASVLDYGAAKADTLRRMHRARPDLRPHVFDVSSDYVQAWDGWVAKSDRAVHAVPAAWTGRFQAIISHFVIEHVAHPVTFLSDLSALLAVGGKLLLSLPDVAANPGDMIVVDHVNHFSEASLRRALTRTGFLVETIDTTTFPGAFFVVAVRLGAAARIVPDDTGAVRAVETAERICAFWRSAAARLDEAARHLAGRRAAIYGSGFYGTWIHARIAARVEVTAFLDQNPKLQGSRHCGLPVVSPSALPGGTELLFVGLNPLKARDIIGAQPALNRPGLRLVWIDG